MTETRENVEPRSLLILDVDGTVREGKDDELGKFVNGPEDVRVFPRAAERIAEWRIETGGEVILISNQGGIELGYVDYETVQAAFRKTVDDLRALHPKTEVWADEVFFCPHHPSVSDCWCRKPRPGLVYTALNTLGRGIFPPEKTLFVGDRAEDEDCAEALGVRFIPAYTWRRYGYINVALGE